MTSESFECRVNFVEATYLPELRLISQDSVTNPIAVRWVVDHYEVTYGNATYTFDRSSTEVSAELLKLSHYETTARNRSLVWVLEMFLQPRTSTKFGLIFGESPWSDLLCAANEPT